MHRYGELRLASVIVKERGGHFDTIVTHIAHAHRRINRKFDVFFATVCTGPLIVRGGREEGICNALGAQ